MQEELTRVCTEAIKRLFAVDSTPEFSRPEEKFGDYATSVALQLAGQLAKSPREIAETLAAELRTDTRFAEVTVAGPGFLNLRLSDSSLVNVLRTEPAKFRANQIVLVEYSDPNPFKPLHAGHLYTTLMGDIISRLVEHSGAKVTRLNYGGDVGLHVGKSMWAILQELGSEHPDKLKAIPEADRPAWLGKRYVAGNTAYTEDAQAKDEIIEINKRVYALHGDNDHESNFAAVYWTCREWSYTYFATLYDQLQVKPFDRFIPESEVTPLGYSTVLAQIDTGVFTESDGAVVFEGDPNKGLHTRVFINSEGLPTYETKDVGLSLTKWQDYQFDESIIITANEQAQYMQVVIAAIREFAPEPANRTRHITHGVVKLTGGTKISSRKGNGPTALGILEAAREAANKDKVQVSEETMLSAVKYAFARQRIGGDIIYNPEESVATEGNSGPYLQYAHARARSILGKATGDIRLKLSSFTPDERTLLRKLTEYPEVVDRACEELMPHYICTYLYELAQEFNRFYEKNRVIGDEREQTRLWLVETYADTLAGGLNLLGIYAPDHM